MRVVVAAAVAGVTAVLSASVPAAASAPSGWTPGDRAGVLSTVSVQRGVAPGHSGNWHTIVLSINGASGVSGTLTDWTCAKGVRPTFELVGPATTCTQESVQTISDAVDEDGASLLSVSVDRRVRNLVADGTVSLTATDGTKTNAQVHLVGRARGALTRNVEKSEDGLTRQVIRERSEVVARGSIAGLPIRTRGADSSASGLVAVTTWVKTSTSAPSFN